MSDNSFERAFSGSVAARPTTFAERIGGAADPLGEVPEASLGKAYKAYGVLPTGNVGEACDIQRWVDGTSVPEGILLQYRFLLRIEYVGEEELRLYLPDCIVILTGRRLGELREKLARRLVYFVRQFSGRLWSGLETPADPIIEAIQIVRPTS